MAIAWIQNAAGQAYGSSASARTISLTGVTSGYCLVCGVSGYSNGVSTMVDGSGNSFTQGLRAVSGPIWSEIWYQLSAVGGSTTITVTPTAAAYMTLFLAEFSGVATSSQPRATASASSGGVVNTISSSSFSATPTSGELIISLINLSTGAGATLTWNSGETTIGSVLNAGSNESGAMGWMLAAGSDGVRQATWSSNANSPQIAALVLKAAATSTVKHFLMTLGCGN